MIALLTPFLPFIATLCFGMLEWFANRKQSDEQSQTLFINLAEALRKLGVKNVKSRYEAEDQLDSNDAAWNEKEKQK